MRGSWAPLSFPRMRFPPSKVRTRTEPGSSFVTVPIFFCPFAAGNALQGGKHRFRGLRRGDKDHSTLAGAVERVKTEKRADRFDFRRDRDGLLRELNAKGCVFDELVEDGGHAAARGIAQNADAAVPCAGRRLKQAV